MAYSNDLRGRLVRATQKGRSARSQADVFEVSASTSVKWVKAFRSEGRGEAGQFNSCAHNQSNCVPFSFGESFTGGPWLLAGSANKGEGGAPDFG